MFRFLETVRREQKKYEKRIQTSVENTENDLQVWKLRERQKNFFN